MKEAVRIVVLGLLMFVVLAGIVASNAGESVGRLASKE